MNSSLRLMPLVLCGLLAACSSNEQEETAASAAAAAESEASSDTRSPALAADFEPPARPAWSQTDNTRKPWTRWWWPGSAVDEQSLTRQLEALADAGIGGVEITPIYGARGAEERYIDFLSPQFMQMLEHTAREAQRLGLGVDMATGTGWPFGGPWVEEADALSALRLQDGRLTGEPTRMLVKRAAPGGEGLVVNPFSAEALGRYLAPFGEVFDDFPDGLIRGQFHDSFEYYDASWAPDLPQVFEAMHGYDVQDYAEQLVGEASLDDATLGRLKSDFRETLHAMHQTYVGAWADWSSDRGFVVRNQSHGAPANLLDLYGLVDIPETEVFGSTPYPIPGLRRDPEAVRHDQSLPEPLVTRMASSASHVMGHPLTSSETATWLRDHWKVTLAYVKPEVDRILLDGINHIFYHGTVYSPEDAQWPGWLFYASTQFNPQNPWWEDFASLNAYVERVQRVLQDGQPDNRVLLYWPIYDLWDAPEGLMQQLTVHDVDFIMQSRTGELARELDDAGFAFDYISDAQIAQTSTRAGALLTPGNAYDVIVVPAAERMPVETLARLVELAEGGATVIFDALPEDVPGLGNLDSRRSAFEAALGRIEFAEEPVPDVRRDAMAEGQVLEGNVVAALDWIGTAKEGFAGTPVDFIRRRSSDGFAYFLANLESEAFAGWVDLAVQAASVTITDPLNGRSGRVAQFEDAGDRTRVWLQLNPGESLLLSTSNESDASAQEWHWLERAGEPISIDGVWEIEFIDGGPVLPEPITSRALESWTSLGDAEAQRFAGTARYTIEFDAPAVQADAWNLDLGDVRESARVRLNGEEVGTAWSLPFQLLLKDELRSGRNVLEIEVTNVAANRIRDMDRRGVPWKIMHEINFVNVRYQPFDASDWPLELSGLLGPVELVPMQAVQAGEGA